MKLPTLLPALSLTLLLLSHIPRVLSQFSIVAVNAGTPIHLQPVTASGLALWLLKPTASFCPVLPANQCPPGVNTAFLAGGQSGTLFMDASVPGGQQAYINKDGSLAYTIAHSAVIPTGADITGFDTTKAGGILGELGVSAFGAKRFVACPKGAGAYQIFANVTGLPSNCTAFTAVTVPYATSSTTFAAWEFT